MKRLLGHLRTAPGDTVAGTVLLLVATALELLQPWPVKWLIDCLLGDQPFPDVIQMLWDTTGVSTPTALAVGLALLAVAFATSHRIVLAFAQHRLITAGNKMVLRLRRETIDHLMRLSLKFHDRSRVGDLLYRAAYDTQAVQSLLTGAAVPLVTGTLTSLGIVAVMLTVDVTLTLVALVTAPTLAMLIRFFGKRIEARSKQLHENESQLASDIQESLSSIRTIQAFTLEFFTNHRLGKQTDDCLHANQRKTATELAFSSAVGIAMAVSSAAALAIGAGAVIEGRLLVGDIVLFLSYLAMLYVPMNALTQCASTARAAAAQLDRVDEVLDLQPAVANRTGAITLDTVQGRLELDRVSFAYNDDSPCIENISLIVEPGQVIGLVGKTGAGKSTLAHLLMRFYDPASGTVSLDGHDLRDLDLTWLRSQFSTVLQEPLLFSGSVRENIAYGRLGATDHDIVQAAKQAEAHEFIERLPDGYDSLLGERGVNLSGGQRQRLSIARAFLKNAPVLLLDEPTSALDPATEAHLVHTLEHLMHGRTTIIVAHRLSTLRNVDVIAVLDQGKLVESGPPNLLLSHPGSLYAQLYATQQDTHRETA